MIPNRSNNLFPVTVYCSLILFLLYGCKPASFPGSPSKTGTRDVPFVTTYDFTFRTRLDSISSPLGNFQIISASDLLNLLSAANITQFDNMGVISGVVIDRFGFAIQDVTLEVTDSEGNIVGDLFYNSLGGIPDFSNRDGTTEVGAFTIFNAPPGDVYIRAVSGGRGNGKVIAFPDQVSQIIIEVLPVVVATIGVTGPINGVDEVTPVPFTNVSVLGLPGINTTSQEQGFFRITLGSGSSFILKLSAKDYIDSYQELFTDLSQLGTAIDLTAFLTVLSEEDLQSFAEAVGVTIDPNKGIIYGKVQESDQTPKNKAIIKITDAFGNPVGRPYYFGGSGEPDDSLTQTIENSRYIIFNLPIEDIYFEVTATTTGTDFEERFVHTGVVTPFPGKVYIKNILLSRLTPLDPRQPSEPPFVVPVGGEITMEDGITRVKGVEISVVGREGVQAVSDSSGFYAINPKSETEGLLAKSSYIFRLKAAGFEDTYRLITTGREVTIRDISIISEDTINDYISAANVTRISGTGIITGKIVENRTGRGTEGITIKVTDADGKSIGDLRYFDRNGLPTLTTETAGNGGYIIFNLPSGLSFVNVTSEDDSGNAVIRAIADGILSLDIGVNNTVPPRISVSGESVDIGTDKIVVPDANVTVMGEGISFSSEKNGAYNRLLSSNNNLILKAAKDGYLDTYNFNFNTQFANISDRDIKIASIDTIAALSSGEGISIEPDNGIIAGEVVFDSFEKKSAISTPVPQNIISGLFDEDIHRDLIVANTDSDTISVYLNKGDGTFTDTPFAIYKVGSRPLGMAAGDFDSDGNIDIAVTSSLSNEVYILLGSGRGTFAIRERYAVENRPVDIASGDINRDDIIDLVVSNADSDSITNLIGTGDGRFINAGNSVTGISPRGLILGDFNGDRVIDLAVANSGAVLDPLTGITEEGITILFVGAEEPFFLPAGDTPIDLISGDFNRDRNTDLAVINAGSGDVYILLINFRGSESQLSIIPIPIGISPSSIVGGDFDRDGRLDIAITDAESNDITVLLGNGDGTFGSAVIITIDTSSNAITTGDFNGDSIRDIIVTSLDSEKIIALFNEQRPIGGIRVEATDMDGDPVGTVRYFDENSGLSVSPASSNSNFIIFNVPEGIAMVRAVSGGAGNRIITSFPDSLSFTKLRIGILEPFTVSVSGFIGDSVGRPIEDVNVDFLGTKVTTTSLSDEINRRDKGKYPEVTLNANSEFIIRLSR
ncbi:MAG: FG-GAP repeat domain-containing protein [Nitrospirota bacterium]